MGNHITVPAEVVALSSSGVEIDAAVINWLGEEIEGAKLTPVTISGGGMTANGDGTYDLVDGDTVVMLQYAAQTENGRTYTLYSNPVTITFEETPGFEGKTISILGDSISTYAGVSNNTDYNTTIGGNKVYYTEGNSYGVSQEDTWWQQTIDQLGLELMVNNSWSGSCAFSTRSGTVGAYIDRCVNLHNDNEADPEDPDIIAIFLGTNDFTVGSTLDSVVDDYADLYTENGDGTYTYVTPTTIEDAYAIMLHKISVRYPDAEVYCLSLLPRENQSDTNETKTLNYSAAFESVAEYYGAYFVDQYHDSGITEVSINFDYYMANSLHPADAGMDAMTTCFVSALQKNSRYSTVKDSLYEVSYTLDDPAIVTKGTDKTAVAGEAFTISFVDQPDYELTVTVTMDGVDITDTCYSGGVVSIPSVSGDITITATAEIKPEDPIENDPKNYRWEYDEGTDAMVNVVSDVFSANSITMTHGSITDGTLKNTRFTLGETVVLNHDQPWSIEWKSTGTWTDNSDGGLLFAEANASGTAGGRYLYRRHKNQFIALGEYDGKYHNYGVDISSIDANAEHVWRLTNCINEDGTNMVYLFVDNVEVGPLNQYYVGGTSQGTTSNWLSGKNFTFNYIGTKPHTIGGCTLEYLQVWESGIPEKTPENYRWEYSEESDVLVNVVNTIFSENELTMTHGSVTDGAFSGVRYTLEESVLLKHDQPWSIEWKGTGDWSNKDNGGLLFAQASASKTTGARYLFRRSGANFIALGEYNGKSFQNYGVDISGIDVSAEHVWRLTNRVSEDGSNMVYLFVDGVEVGALNQYYVNVTAKNTTSDWVSGKDFTFNYMGTTPHTISGCTLEYIQVWESGIVVDKTALQEAVDTAKELTEEDYTSDTWAAVEDALAKAEAVLADNDATQEEVDAAEEALTEAVEAILKRGDKTALEELVEEVKAMDEEAYVSDTWAAVEEALAAAEEVLADIDATQEEIDAAEDKLEEALAALVERGDKTELQADVDTANGLTEEDYVTETWAALEEALAEAEEVLADIDATQEEIDAAEDKLEETLAALMERGDKTELEEAVEDAEKLPEVAYTDETWEAVEEALADAKDVLADIDATQEDVDAALEALEDAVAALEFDSVQPGTGSGTVTEPDDGDDDDKDPVEVCPSAHLTDVPAVIWYHEYVDYVVANGLMTGVTATTFDPDGTMTRAMVWTVLARLSGEDVDGGTPWYAEAQEWAMENEVSDGTMANNAITREQLVTMLYRYIGEPEVSAADKALLDDYTDGEKVSDWAKDAMAWAISNGIINGVTKDTLDPQGVATRAQVAAILQRFCEL